MITDDSVADLGPAQSSLEGGRQLKQGKGLTELEDLGDELPSPIHFISEKLKPRPKGTC